MGCGGVLSLVLIHDQQGKRGGGLILNQRGIAIY